MIFKWLNLMALKCHSSIKIKGSETNYITLPSRYMTALGHTTIMHAWEFLYLRSHVRLQLFTASIHTTISFHFMVLFLASKNCHDQAVSNSRMIIFNFMIISQLLPIIYTSILQFNHWTHR